MNSRATPGKKKASKPTRPKPVSYRDVSVIIMAARDDQGKKQAHTVIHDGEVKHYVGIGWVSHGKAEPADYLKYPEVK